MNYIKKHSNLFLMLGLLFFFIILYCLKLANFSFIDYDESKYALIARDMLNSHDWINLKLSGDRIFDCPPLLFWLINLSFIVFGKISAVSIRMPSVIFCILAILTLFYSVSKILTKSYAVIISVIISTCFGVVAFSHLATNDMLYTSSVMIALLCTYQILLVKSNENNLLLRIFTHLFIGLSILSGGFFGLLPALIIIIMHIFAGKLKNVFKLRNWCLAAITLLLVLPWFVLMAKNNGMHFIKEFLIQYNFLKYMGLKEYSYNILLFIIGFMPWTFSFFWIIGTRFKSICGSFISYLKDDSQDKLNEKWHKLRKVDKFLSLNTIVFFTTLIFAILYGSKNIYLILLLMFPASCIAGHYWYEYMFRKKHGKSIFFATIIPNIIFILCAIGLLLGYNYINSLSIYGVTFFVVPLVVIFFLIPLFSVFSVILKGRMSAFLLNIILMVCISFVLTPSGYNFIITNSGEGDLIEFARKAHSDNVNLSAFIPSRKYSIEYYYENDIDYHSNNDYKWLSDFLNNNDKDYIIAEIKDLWEIEEKGIKYMLLDSGKRYCLIKHLPKDVEEQMAQEEEPEIIIQ